MLDVLAERLARHVHAGEELAAERAPGVHPTGKDGDVVVAEFTQLRRRALRQAVVGVAEDDPRRPARHEPRELQLEARKRQRRGEEEMPLGEDALFADVEERELPAVLEHRGERRRADASRGHFRWRAKNSIVRFHASSAAAGWYSVIGSLLAPTAVSLANACCAW